MERYHECSGTADDRIVAQIRNRHYIPTSLPFADRFPQDWKKKAVKAKDATVSKAINTKDRLQSTPSAKTNWDYSNPPPRRPPPVPVKTRDSELYGPPPSRSNSSRAEVDDAVSAPPAPVLSTRPSIPSRSTRPSLPTRSPEELAPPPVRPPPMPARRSTASIPASQHHEEVIDKIDWANLSPEDKEVFFSWLDEFFSRLTGRHVGPTAHPTFVSSKEKFAHPPANEHAPAPAPAYTSAPAPADSPAPNRRLPPALSPSHASGPPPIVHWSRPKLPSSPSPAPVLTPAQPPRPTQHDQPCLARDLAQYFHPTTPWDHAWYLSPSATPPPLAGSAHMLLRASRVYVGKDETLTAGVLFSDLSICWFSLSFTRGDADADPNRAGRAARYRPPPPPLDRDSLVRAHGVYGEAVAGFVARFTGTANMAAEALRQFERFPGVEPPVPSVYRTHGHLVFAGSADTGVGTWCGGDTALRRGDIISWRDTRHHMGRGYLAGDHTSVVLRECAVQWDVEREMSLSRLGTLEVVEQGGVRREFDMDGFLEGTLEVYRPVGVGYLGLESLDGLLCPGDGIEV
ncbi:hypothetical protein GLOTRDRAFT_128906 [Gloeophyllum trabeum ATCC 11539]|uniref:BBC1/AIM3 cysteine proteinase-fold domain-containing protein n=1 Tax=Gloeophyllum trabeum (strain ATCC 11539 / FP-39264 / Madison 617) TaxID=670483 RepID=S7RRS8_GLOTA|nr:uncharacterized protein GLOTRDRAFT_128906 [Gloeophyllum trabeum ATCC 11539]EPQ55694.1 hypothetical protein GLOTRDRAFT_128906 [Gloeophyllum trabeum ATCC 11539]